MLRLHTGSDINLLADSLLSELSEHPSTNPLAPELFVVQNYGMASWLSLQIAEKQGIAANLKFKFPAELYWQIIRQMKPDIPENLPSERRPMTWAIFEILQSDADSSLDALHQYVQNEDAEKQEMRCWQLACHIGDVFDQYLTYRPEMLLDWEANNVVYKTNDPSERWQAALWQKLNTHWQSDDWSHRANLQNEIITAIDNSRFDTNTLPTRISIFGVSEMPPVYTSIFLKLSKCTNVHFYLTDIATNDDHNLVHSLGQAGREFKNIRNNELKRDKEIKWSKNESKSSVKQNDQSLFRAFQNDLLNGQETEQTLNPDNTIQIHSCHSARREVEVLYDQLLDIFDQNHDIDPSEVLVLSPQMEAYVSDVNAVFGAVEEGVPEIPFNISESNHARLVDLSFIKIMQLVDSRFKVTEVLDLLDFSPIREAFSFSEDDIHTLEMWIDNTRIRWGIDALHKQSLDVPASKAFTWQAGLHRMLSGYAMAQTGDVLFEGIYPYDEIEDSTHADLLGRFSRFMHYLYGFHNQVKDERLPQKWADLFNDWLDIFFPDDDITVRQIQSLRNVINGLDNETNRAQFNNKVHFQIVRNYIKDQLDQQQTGGGRRGQGVTFSSMIPMRNIPAKVIALVGMNDDAFPRAGKGVGFDLLTKYPKQGDRVQSKIDRQIFLEALMAAREMLYISYTGQSNKKDVEYPPSVLVKELTKTIENKYGINSKELIKTHHIHAFSQKYYSDKGADIFSYSKVSRNVARQLYAPDTKKHSFFTGELPEPDPAYKMISVNDLISFFQHPAKFLFNQRLGIYLRDDSVLDEDRESFVMNSLERYSLSQKMLNRLLNEQPLKSYEKVANANNLLPEGWPGHKAFTQQAEEVTAFSEHIQAEFDQEQLDPVEVHYKSGAFAVTGRLDTIYTNAQLFYRFGKLRAKDRIAFWIKHLLFQKVKPDNHSGQSVFMARDKYKSVEVCRLAPVPEPGQIFDELLNLYWQGLHDRLMFFPKTSFAFAEAILEKGKNEEEGIAAAHKEWDDDWNDYREEIDDYNKLYIGEDNLLSNSKLRNKFKNISKLVWSPFFKYENVRDD